jgi:hypothetical protein
MTPRVVGKAKGQRRHNGDGSEIFKVSDSDLYINGEDLYGKGLRIRKRLWSSSNWESIQHMLNFPSTSTASFTPSYII